MPSLTLTTVNLNAPDARALAEFYSALLGWPVVDREPGWATVRDPAGGIGLSFEEDRAYVPPVWPTRAGAPPQQMHLDIRVDDLAEAGRHAESLGARLAEHQPQDDVRVYLDPAGHPFCLWTG